MAMTPYEDANPALEYPSILVSEDKESWAVPDGLTNPITTLGAVKADPDLSIDGDGTMWCVYRNNGLKSVEAVSSTDGITWSAAVTLLAADAAYSYHSPAVVYFGGQWLMFHMNNVGGDPNQLVRHSAAAITGPWGDPVVCTISPAVPATMDFLWHLDVIDYGGGVLVGFFNYDNSDSYLAVSLDGGETWRVRNLRLIERGDGDAGEWDPGHYRGTIVKTATGLDLWYSAFRYGVGDAPIDWRIGYTPVVWQCVR
jgi:hypothetical protein